MKISKYIIATSFVLLSISVFSQTKISSEEAFKKLEDKKIQLVDVRTTEEFSKKHLKNSVNINWNDRDNFEKSIGKLDKKKPIYVYCLSGGRSNKAAQYLTQKGFEVFEIQGGIMQWEKSNLPLVNLDRDIKGITYKEFKTIISSHPMVLVDFFADWCAPCKELTPIVDKIASNHKEKVIIIKINVDENSTLTKQLGITGIPKLVIYKKGKKTWSKSGLTDYETIEKALM